jgi:hypothetical protein
MIITLTSDFGTRDPFVAAMKGVIASIAPRATIVDITHEIPPYDIVGGAFVLSQAWRWFPRKTIHVVVVDPGVGTERRPILAEAGGHYFIAPDNGVLSMIYQSEKHKVRALTNRKYFLARVSRTFHGRDVFAPSAAHLARGATPASFGKLIHNYTQLAAIRPNRQSRAAWTGTVLHVDRFGNLITNFHCEEFDGIRKGPFEISVGLQRVTRLALTFADCEPGELFALAGSSGYIEIAVNQGSAAKQLGCGPGAPVDLVFF